jgi:hypothetical protein
MQIKVPTRQQNIKMRFERGILYTSSVILGDTSIFYYTQRNSILLKIS